VRRGGRWILRGIDLEVSPGSTCGIVGPNGSGKSTLLRVIAGYEFPTSGVVEVLGRRLGETDLAELREHIRLVGTPGLSDQSQERLDFAADSTLLQVALTGTRGHLANYEAPTPSQTRWARRQLKAVGVSASLRWGAASAGERTRALLARARMPGTAGGGLASLLLLDEPTAHLDLIARESVVAALNSPSADTAQVIVTHHVEELPPSTGQVLLLRGGRVVAAGVPSRVLTGVHLTQAFGPSPGQRVRVKRSRVAGGFRFSASVVGG
jgi:iron complex transport system ATP-binding protein